jgi:hypothetical protein
MLSRAFSNAARIEGASGNASRMNASPKLVRSRSLLHPKDVRSAAAAVITIDRSSLTLACSAPGLAESSPPKGVDAEVVALASRGLLP